MQIKKPLTAAVSIFCAILLPNAVFAANIWRIGDVNADALSASSFPWSYYTHVEIYGLNCNGSGSLANVEGYNTANWPSYRSAATTNGVKMLLLIGGDMTTCTNAANLSTYVNKVAGAIKGTDTSLNTKGVVFDGADLDWESGFGSGTEAQYENFISALRTALGSSKLMTMDGWRSNEFLAVLLNQANNLDRFNNEMYDSAFTGAGNSSGQTWSWYNMANQSVDAGLNSGSAEGSANWYAAAGFPISKINEGIPFYGYLYSGCTHSEVVGCTTQVGGQYSYKTIRNNSAWWNSPHSNDSKNGADYIVPSGQNEYLTYSDTMQIGQLTSWGKTAGLGGYFVWEVGDENLGGGTQAQSFPLSFALFSDTSGSSVTTTCDINGDGTVNVSDVQSCVNQALGVTTCSSCNLTQASPVACNAVDVQRDVNAALGGQCVTGP